MSASAKRVLCTTNPVQDRSGLRVPFARCSDGSARHVTAVSGRDQGPFSCLQCEEQLILRTSVNGRPHFAHRGDSRCSGETLLHQYAKEVLLREKRITIPAKVLSFEGLKEQVAEAQVITFEEIVPELGFGSFRPDAVGTLGKARLAIEFKVTHEVDENKRQRIAARNISTVEIDLLALRKGAASADELDRFILHEAPRDWVHHRGERAGAARLKTKVKERAASRRRAFQARLLNPPCPEIDRERVEHLTRAIEEAGLQHLVGMKVACPHWFTVPPRLWQAAALTTLVIDRAELYTPGRALTAEPSSQVHGDYGKAIDPWMIRTDLNRLSAHLLRDAGMTRGELGSPHSAVVAYLAAVAEVSSIISWDAEGRVFYIGAGLHGRLYRRAALRSKVFRLLELVEHDGDHHQIWNAWCRAPIMGDRVPAHLAAIGDEPFNDLNRHLTRLIGMAQSWGEPAIECELLGLPIESILESARLRQGELNRKRAEEAERAAGERADSISARARELLGDEAAAWLSAPQAGATVSRRIYATENTSNLESVYADLWCAVEERRLRLARDQERTTAQNQLRAAAKRAFTDERHAALFLHSGHHKLGGRRPLDACDSQPALASILNLLPLGRR